MRIRNQITLIGNVGRQPETKTLPSGTTVTEFSLATNEVYKNREGERQQRTDWHRLKAFGKLGETLGRYLGKGSKIAVMGTLRYSSWEDRHGQQRTTAEVYVSEFTFLGGNRQTSEADAELQEVAEMVTAEPSPKKTGKRRASAKKGKATKAVTTEEATAAEDLPF